jgi:hypothetical protein
MSSGSPNPGPQMPPLIPSKRPGNRTPRTTTERGYGHRHQQDRRRHLSQHPICERCSASWSQHLHHRDHNPHNRHPSNYEALCVGCHQAEHS